jgi:hypothetical protein
VINKTNKKPDNGFFFDKTVSKSKNNFDKYY